MKQQLDALERRCIQEMQGDATVARAERQLLDGHERWCEEHEVVHTDDWRKPSLHRSRGGRYPYPGFSSLVHTSYINATLQCLLHCSAARAGLLAPPQGNGEDLVVANELHALATACVRGVGGDDDDDDDDGDGDDQEVHLRRAAAGHNLQAQSR